MHVCSLTSVCCQPQAMSFIFKRKVVQDKAKDSKQECRAKKWSSILIASQPVYECLLTPVPCRNGFCERLLLFHPKLAFRGKYKSHWGPYGRGNNESELKMQCFLDSPIQIELENILLQKPLTRSFQISATLSHCKLINGGSVPTKVLKKRKTGKKKGASSSQAVYLSLTHASIHIFTSFNIRYLEKQYTKHSNEYILFCSKYFISYEVTSIQQEILLLTKCNTRACMLSKLCSTSRFTLKINCSVEQEYRANSFGEKRSK